MTDNVLPITDKFTSLTVIVYKRHLYHPFLELLLKSLGKILERVLRQDIQRSWFIDWLASWLID